MLSARAAKWVRPVWGSRKGPVRFMRPAITRSRRATAAAAIEKVDFQFRAISDVKLLCPSSVVILSVEGAKDLLAVVPLQPVPHLLKDVPYLLGEPGEMRRSRISDHADRLATFSEKDEQLAPLEGRYAQVGFPVEDEKRGGDLVRVHDGGKAQEWRGVLLLQAGIVIDLRDITGWNEAQPIRDAGTFDRGPIALGLRDGPGRHETTGAPSEDGEAARIGPPLGDGEVGCAVHVAVGPVAEMLVDRVEELRAVACRSTVLRLQHDVSQAGDEACEGVQPEDVIAFGTPVRQDEEGCSGVCAVTSGKGGDSLEVGPLGPGPVHDSHIAEADVRDRAVTLMGELDQTVAATHGDVRGVRRIADGEGHGGARLWIGREDRQPRDASADPSVGCRQLPIREAVDLHHHALVHLHPY